MSKNLYMHTMNGKPAFYQDGTYICFIDKTIRVKASDVFVGSLKAIERQQQWSRQWCEENGGYNDDIVYGYIRIQNDIGEQS